MKYERTTTTDVPAEGYVRLCDGRDVPIRWVVPEFSDTPPRPRIGWELEVLLFDTGTAQRPKSLGEVRKAAATVEQVPVRAEGSRHTA